MTFLNFLLLPVLFLRLLFDGEGSSGDAGGAGDPPAGDAKPTPPPTGAKPAGDTKPDAKDDELGEGGKAALEAERVRARTEKRRADAAETELQRLRDATQSESEKAINDAKKEARTESDAKWSGIIRQVRVEGALIAAGCSDPAIASRATEFAELSVSDTTGEVEGLTATVEAFKAAHPTLFTARVPGGDADQGVRAHDAKPLTYEEAVQQQLAQQGSASRAGATS